MKITGGYRSLTLHRCSHWAHSCSFTRDFSGIDEAQVASLCPWETGPLYSPSDCFQHRRRHWPSRLISEFHICSWAQNVTFCRLNFSEDIHAYSKVYIAPFFDVGLKKAPAFAWIHSDKLRSSCAVFSISKLLQTTSIWLCHQQRKTYLFNKTRQLKTNYALTLKASQRQNLFHAKKGLWLDRTRQNTDLNVNSAAQLRQQKVLYVNRNFSWNTTRQRGATLHTRLLCKPKDLCGRLQSRLSDALPSACHKSLHSCFLRTCPPRGVADLVHLNSFPAKQK